MTFGHPIMPRISAAFMLLPLRPLSGAPGVRRASTDEVAIHRHFHSGATEGLFRPCGTPPISNNSRPGFTTATQYSGLPFPEPMRVSAGF